MSGFGFYIPGTNRLTHNTKEGRILSLLRREKDADEILFHHRLPTSTGNVRTGCHPYSSKDFFKNNYVLVHNGVLQNESKLREEHAKRGIEYVSMQEDGRFNDSEALMWDIARYLEGEVEEITAAGSIAFICTKRDNQGKPIALFFGRNHGNPLKMKKTKFSITLSSEGEGELIDINTLYCFNYETEELTKTKVTIPYSSWGGTYGGYRGPGFQHSSGYRSPSPSGGYNYTGGTTSKRLPAPKIEVEPEADDEFEMERQFVKNEAETLLWEAKYDYGVACINASASMAKLNKAIEDMDLRLEDKTESNPLTEEDMQRYSDYEARVELLRRAITYIRFEEGRRRKGGADTPRSGFPATSKSGKSDDAGSGDSA